MSAAVKVGDVLYLPPERKYQDWSSYTVTKIGRVWISLDSYGRTNKCSIDGLMLDRGGYSPRQLYRDKEEYENSIRLSLAWRDFEFDVRTVSADGKITLETIAQARALLGLDNKKVKS